MSRTPMKLILTQEVGDLGAPGDVVDVASGYGRNYLIPRGFAMPWTRGAEKQIELIKRARSAREIRGAEDAKLIADELEGLHVRMRRRAGGNGRLFGSVGPADIAAAVLEAGGPVLDRRRIEVRDPIKTHRLAPGPRPAASRGHRLGRHRYRGQLGPRLPGQESSPAGPGGQPGLSYPEASRASSGSISLTIDQTAATRASRSAASVFWRSASSRSMASATRRSAPPSIEHTIES